MYLDSVTPLAGDGATISNTVLDDNEAQVRVNREPNGCPGRSRSCVLLSLQEGGAVYITNSELRLQYSSVSHNVAAAKGGARRLDCVMFPCGFLPPRPHSSALPCVAGGFGGAVAVVDSSVALQSVALDGNSASVRVLVWRSGLVAVFACFRPCCWPVDWCCHRLIRSACFPALLRT